MNRQCQILTEEALFSYVEPLVIRELLYRLVSVEMGKVAWDGSLISYSILVIDLLVQEKIL